ncbi:hypothetical protein BDN70DRAFT_872175 [Pholiota conissans]|uniref:DUF6818 domain-containing protein n=1 Tax=Pholiota conissans TaxID=109636 RepID=A0A9P6D6H5_9AGAR|nr:hypothetical protein BDN70DRAFT_872175 [Pholiota conissans]
MDKPAQFAQIEGHLEDIKTGGTILNLNDTDPLSPANTPFAQSGPNEPGTATYGAPWRISNHPTGGSTNNQPARQMGDYMTTFSSTPSNSMPFHFGDDRNIFTSFHGGEVDPSQIPLPSTSDMDLHHGPTIAHSTGHASMSKVAGSRRTKVPAHNTTTTSSAKAKGKRKRDLSSSDSDASDDSEAGPPGKKTHGGRRPGAGNYGDMEIKKLLDLIEKELPVGQNGWKRVHAKYCVWAQKRGHSARDVKALEAKFKMLVKVRKPTGSGKRPENITRAKAIDKLITEKVGTRNINDSESNDDDDDDDGNSSDLDDHQHDPTPARQHTVVARSEKSSAFSSRRPRINPAMELAQKLAVSLDPEAQRARDDERANRSLQATQIFTLSQQIRDLTATNETLRSELTGVRDRLHEIERQRDRLDAELNFERRMAGLNAQQRGFLIPSHKYDPGLTRVKGKIRHDEFFPEGGHSVTWITDGSSASDWEENKENIPAPHVFSPTHATTYKPQHRKYRTLCPRPPTPPPSSSSFASTLANAPA